MMIENKIIQYLEGELSEEEAAEVAKKIRALPDWQQVYNEFKTIMNDLEEMPLEMPSNKLVTNVKQLIKSEKRQTKSAIIIPFRYKVILQSAAAILLLLVGFLIGQQHTNKHQLQALQYEITETKSMLILSMLEKPSASERIKAVNFTQDYTKVNQEIMDALVMTMRQDENVNVRIKAAEGLAKFKDDQVISLLIQTLQEEKDVEMQFTLIDILTNLGTKEAVQELKDIIKREATPDFIKEKASQSIQSLL